jgi:phage terminase large subunit-like protein
MLHSCAQHGVYALFVKVSQELNGALLLDPQNALFRDGWIIRDPVPEELIEQASVGVDPSGGDGEVGIVVGALLTDGTLVVLADRSLSAAYRGPGAREFSCDGVCVKINFGGAMATEVINQAADHPHQAALRKHNMISRWPTASTRRACVSAT